MKLCFHKLYVVFKIISIDVGKNGKVKIYEQVMLNFRQKYNT